LKDFYDSMFPLPSSYELPPGQLNQFLYMEEYRKYKEEQALELRRREEEETKIWKIEREREERNTTITIALISVALCLVCYTCKRCVSTCYKRRQSREQRFLKLLNP